MTEHGSLALEKENPQVERCGVSCSVLADYEDFTFTVPPPPVWGAALPPHGFALPAANVTVRLYVPRGVAEGT